MTPRDSAPKSEGEFLLYSAPKGEVKISIYFEDETAWLSQKAMAEVFDVQVPAIAKHLKNIFESGELAEDSVVSILETTAADNKTYKTKHYSLDAIIAVGYRVNSYQATQFRIWATEILREFMIKGFALDDDRLKRGKALFGRDYFESDWANFLDRFLQLSDYKILENPGKVGALEAKLKAEAEYEKFRVRQDREYISDFDREVARLTGKDKE